MRTAALALLLLPYLYYSGKDNAFHFRGRKVTLPEHILHLGIGVAAAGLIAGAFLRWREQLLRALPVLLIAGALDEFVFHRGLPEAESDMHAKAHWALLLFIVAGLAWP